MKMLSSLSLLFHSVVRKKRIACSQIKTGHFYVAILYGT